MKRKGDTMSEPKKRVTIQLKTSIQDGQEREENQLEAIGFFFNKKGLDVLQFTEKLDDDAEVSTLITIHSEKISIKRSGAVSMHQQFRLGQKTENVYQHLHGHIHMETYTRQIAYYPPSKGLARLAIDYTVKLNGQSARNHTLELQFTEEDCE